MENQKNSFTRFIIMPRCLRYDKSIKPRARDLYMTISELQNEKGYAFPTNSYLADMCDCGVASIKRDLSSLVSGGYLKITYEDEKTHEGRRIFLVMDFKSPQLTSEPPPSSPVSYPQLTSEPHNNTNNNNTNNIINTREKKEEFPEDWINLCKLFLEYCDKEFNKKKISKSQKEERIIKSCKSIKRIIKTSGIPNISISTVKMVLSVCMLTDDDFCKRTGLSKGFWWKDKVQSITGLSRDVEGGRKFEVVYNQIIKISHISKSKKQNEFTYD